MRKPYQRREAESPFPLRHRPGVKEPAIFDQVKALATRITNNIRKQLETGYTIDMTTELVSDQTKLFVMNVKFHGVTTSRMTIGVAASATEMQVWGNLNGQPQGPFDSLEQLLAAIKKDHAWVLR